MALGFPYERNPEFWERKGKIPLWRIAEQINCSEMTLTRWLRKELDPEKKERILTVLKELNSCNAQGR